MGDFGLEVKLPQDLIDIIPQERITGDILHGHGPRRGNLEALLRYWRPIMKKPGGFRRCIVILANHPELYPLQRICAWLHHETTGKWPNEGNHHGVRGGGRAGRVLRRAIPGKRKRRRGKSDSGVEIASWRIYRRLGGMATRPINGDQNAVEYKAARFKQGCRSVPMPGSFEWDEHYVRSPLDTLDFKRIPRGPRAHGRGGRLLSSLGSFFTPGDMGKYRSPGRSLLWGALTPGGGGLGGGGLGGGGLGGGGGIGGGLPTIAAAEALRCPSGYLNGGRFTDPKLTNCGGVLFDSPSKGPGAVTEVDIEKMTRRFESAQAEDLPDLVRDIVINKPQGDPFAVIREAAMRPKTKPNKKRRDSSTVDVISHLSENENETRLVRRDGAVLEPTLGPEALARVDHDSIKDSIYVTSKIPEQGQMTGDEVRLLTRGAKAIVYAFPEGSVTLSRKKDLDVATASRIRTRWGGLVRHANLSHNPAEAMLRLAKEFADSLSVSTDFRNISGADERVVVYNVSGERRIVPRWIFQTFLSLRAPRRPLGVVKPFSLVPPGEEEGGPTKSEYWRPERGQFAVLEMEQKALSLRSNPVPWKGSTNLSSVLIGEEYRKESLIDFKAAKFGRALEDPEMMVKGLLRGRMRGRRISKLARRMPKVVPYDPDAVDGEGDGLVQDGTIWERPVGTRFTNLNAGARRLLVGAYLVNAQGKRREYSPGEHPKSPIGQRYQPKFMGARRIGASIASRGRRGSQQVIDDRDVRLRARADFTPQQARAELRRLNMQRRIRRIRTQPEYRARRANRLQGRSDRNYEIAEERFAEARDRATERNAEREEREVRREAARAPRRARREMSLRFRDENVASRMGLDLPGRVAREDELPSARERRKRVGNLIARQDRERAELNLESPSALRRRRGERVIRRGERRDARSERSDARSLERADRRTPAVNLRSMSDEDLIAERKAGFGRHYNNRTTYSGIGDLPDDLKAVEKELRRRRLPGPWNREGVEVNLRERVRRVGIEMLNTGERVRDHYNFINRKKVKDQERVEVAEELGLPVNKVEEQLSLFGMPSPLSGQPAGDEVTERLADAAYSGLVDASDDSQRIFADWAEQVKRLRMRTERPGDLRDAPENIRVDADDDIDDLIRATDSPFDTDGRMASKSREVLMVGDLWIHGESPIGIAEARTVEELMEAVEDNISFVAKPAEFLARLEMIMDGLGSARMQLRRMRVPADGLFDAIARRFFIDHGVGNPDGDPLIPLLKARVLQATRAEGIRNVGSAYDAALRVVSGLRIKSVDDVDGPEKARIEIEDAQILARIVAPQMRARLAAGKAVRVKSANDKWTFTDYGVDIDEVFRRVADGTPLRERDVKALEALVDDAFLLGRVIQSTRDPELEFLIVDRGVDPSDIADRPASVLRTHFLRGADAPSKVLRVRQDKGKIEVRFSGKILARRSGGKTLYGGEQIAGFGWSDVGSIERAVSWGKGRSGNIVGKIDNIELDLDRPGSGITERLPVRVKNMGLSTVVGSHAELSLSATGVVESTLSGKDEGLLAFGMAGFRNLEAEEQMMEAIGRTVRSYRMDGPSNSQIILNDNMANALEELLDIHNRHDDVSFLHVHQILNDSRFLPKGSRRHPWRVVDESRRDEDLSPPTGIAEADRYGDWWVANAPFRDGSVRLDGEVGEWLEDARSGPRIFDTDFTEGYQAARTPGDPSDPDRHRRHRKQRGRRGRRRHQGREGEPSLEEMSQWWRANEHMFDDEQIGLMADGLLRPIWNDATDPSPVIMSYIQDLARETLARRNEANRPDEPEQEELLGLSGPNFTAKDTQYGRVNPDDHRLGWYPEGLDPNAVHEMSLSDAEVLLSEIEAAIRYNDLEDLDSPQIIVPDRSDLRPSLRKLNNHLLEDIQIGLTGKIRRGEEQVPRGARRSAWRMERDPNFYREYLKKSPQGRQKHIDDIPGFFLSELSKDMAKELKKGRWILEFDGGDLDFRFNEDRFDVVGHSSGEVLLRAKERGIGYKKGDYLRVPIHTDDSREARLAKKSTGLPFPSHSPVWTQWRPVGRTRPVATAWWDFTQNFLDREWPKAQKERLGNKDADGKEKRPPMGRDYSGESLEEWNQLDLSDGSFVGADSPDADLHKMNLSGSDLSKSKFVGTDLGESNIERSDFTESDLSEVEMTDAMASHANFRKAILEGGQFVRTDFRNARFFGAKASGANFEEANLADADMSVMDLQGANLTGAVLIGANLEGADLTGADLTDADLRGVDLSRATLTDAILTGANGWRTVWPEGFDPVAAGVDVDAPLGRWPDGGPIVPDDLDADAPDILKESDRLLKELQGDLSSDLVEAIDPEKKKEYFERSVEGVDAIIATLGPEDEDSLLLFRAYRAILILAENMSETDLKAHIEMLSRIDEGELPGGLDPRAVGIMPHLMAPARDDLGPIDVGRLSGFQHALMINWELKKDSAGREMRRAAKRLSQEELGKRIEAMEALEPGAVIMDMPEMDLGDNGLILFGNDEEYLFAVRLAALFEVYNIRNGQDHLGEIQFRPGNNPYKIDAEGNIFFDMDMNVEGEMDVEAAGMVREVEEHLAGAVHPDDQSAINVPGGGTGLASQNEKVRRLSEIDAEIDRLVGGRNIDTGAEDLSGAARRESLREQFGDMEPEDVERLGRLLDEEVAINNSFPKDDDNYGGDHFFPGTPKGLDQPAARTADWLVPTRWIGEGVRVSEIGGHPLDQRPFVRVQKADGSLQPFYRSEGVWLPFDGFGGPQGPSWYRNNRFTHGEFAEGTPLHRFGSEENKAISELLGRELGDADATMTWRATMSYEDLNGVLGTHITFDEYLRAIDETSPQRDWNQAARVGSPMHEVDLKRPVTEMTWQELDSVDGAYRALDAARDETDIRYQLSEEVPDWTPEEAAYREEVKAELAKRHAHPDFDYGTGPNGSRTEEDERRDEDYEHEKEVRKERGRWNYREDRKNEFRAMSDEELEKEYEKILADNDEAVEAGEYEYGERYDVRGPMQVYRDGVRMEDRKGGMTGFHADDLTDLETVMEERSFGTKPFVLRTATPREKDAKMKENRAEMRRLIGQPDSKYPLVDDVHQAHRDTGEPFGGMSIEDEMTVRRLDDEYDEINMSFPSDYDGDVDPDTLKEVVGKLTGDGDGGAQVVDPSEFMPPSSPSEDAERTVHIYEQALRRYQTMNDEDLTIERDGLWRKAMRWREAGHEPKMSDQLKLAAATNEMESRGESLGDEVEDFLKDMEEDA